MSKARALVMPAMILVGIAGAIACGRALSNDDIPAPPPELTNDGDGATTADGAPVGDGGAPLGCTCLPPVPDGWQGPFVSDELADCVAPWNEDAGPPVHAELDAGAHECSCTCSAAPPHCLQYDSYEPSCTNRCSNTLFDLPDASCFSMADNCFQYVRIVVDGGGPCTPNASSVIDDAGWRITARRCGAAIKTGVCDDPAAPCAPKAPATGAQCISHDGDTECPPKYPVKHVYYAGFTDTRICTSCSCGDAGAPCEVGWYGDSGCAETDRAGTAPVTSAYCPARPSSAPYLKLYRREQACAATGGQKNGDVTLDGQLTVCCLP